MTLNEFHILNAAFNRAQGRTKDPAQVHMTAAEQAAVSAQLAEKGLLTAEGEITDAGRRALYPYRVRNAVIMAAGASTRFIPLSLEQPKGLFEVRGERLIERQIRQLIEAGITDITVVLGYKKDMFAFLREKYGVSLVFNPDYMTKNNIESLYTVRHKLGSTYILACDNYFAENPFNLYEYRTFYAGYTTEKKTNQIYARVDENDRILDMLQGEDHGRIVTGHAYWQQDFCDSFIALADADRTVGNYNSSYWERLVKDNIDEMPPIYFKEYEPNSIYEFDYFEELRQFDNQYIGHSHSAILRNIKLVFRCDEEDIVNFRTVSEGLTNTSFIFRIDGTDYIYRHPGDGTESIINRRNEKTSLIKAKEFDIDPTYIYMDVEEGWKISRFVTSFREPDYENFEDSKKVLAVLRRLHAAPIRVDYGLRPWEDAEEIEKLLLAKDPDCFAQWYPLKEKIGRLYAMTQGDGVEKCFCHGDTYKPNWMMLPDGGVILIDWEYSGWSDPGVDVGYYIVDAMYDSEKAEAFIREYLADDYTPTRRFHFMAYTAIIAYYWFVWAMYRESCDAPMGDALPNWRDMAVYFADYLLKEIDG